MADATAPLSSPTPNVAERAGVVRLRRSPRMHMHVSAETASKVPNNKKPKLMTLCSSHKKKTTKSETKCFWIGDPIPIDQARLLWPRRYQQQQLGSEFEGPKKTSLGDIDQDDFIFNVKCHYAHASIAGHILELGDCAYVKGEKGKANYIGRILELFETMDGDHYFSVQWFFRAEDTVIKELAVSHDKKRVFYSNTRNDNLLDCIVSKIKVVQVDSRLDSKSIPECDFYYDTKYSVDYSTFCTMVTNSSRVCSDLFSNCTGNDDKSAVNIEHNLKNLTFSYTSNKEELALLDLYSGCGAMSTGLCLGAKFAGMHLVTKWAVDSSQVACESVKLNHPETQVRNESAEDFLELLKEWVKLSKRYSSVGDIKSKLRMSNNSETDCEVPPEEFEVSKLVDICYGDPNKLGKRGLMFKVRWKGYGPSEDTWEPIEGLSKCQDAIEDFVVERLKSKIIPIPGDVDVVCGGPPCQGISGLNRYRNVDAPLDDERNHQIVVFMNVVKFLRPKYILMENVVDILKFSDGYLARYALSRLVDMNYQARLGIMAAGCYGLPQFRLRIFLWGAHPSERLPQYPLPTHDVVLRGAPPNEFARNIVAYDEDQPRELEKALFLYDAISDLPAVTNDETRDEMPYGKDPETEFQRYIRSKKSCLTGSSSRGEEKVQRPILYDHRPLKLYEDDYHRVCEVPQRKGASFRDFPGVITGVDNKVVLDPKMDRVLLPSGKPLVPDYCFTFEGGKSKKSFARLWWDETVATVTTLISPRNQATTHPDQDRVLTIRECARLQGFPDYYKLCGTVKERYRQVGNAVAIPVARALGYALGMAWLKLDNDEPLLTLPPKFYSTTVQHQLSSSSEVNG